MRVEHTRCARWDFDDAHDDIHVPAGQITPGQFDPPARLSVHRCRDDKAKQDESTRCIPGHGDAYGFAASAESKGPRLCGPTGKFLRNEIPPPAGEILTLSTLFVDSVKLRCSH